MARKTILITGASSGIGKAAAIKFQANGWNVVATMRNPSAGEDLARLENTLVTRLDVTDDASISEAVSQGINRFGGIDVLLNNAGYGAYGVLEAFDMERVRRQFDTNVLGLIAVTKAVLPFMRAVRSGTVINISSIGGQMTFPLGSLYHATKFAVEGFSESLLFELETIGLRVKIVEPGMTATNFGTSSFDFAHDDALDDYQAAEAGMRSVFQHHTQHISDPETIAEVIFEAATDDSSRLRYRAGADANSLLAARKELDEDSFIDQIRSRMV